MPMVRSALRMNLRAMSDKAPSPANVVSVTVEGSAYRIAVDFKALVGLASAMDPGVKLDITPLAVLAKPLPDGNWEVASDSVPGGSFEFDGPQGHQSMNWSVADARFSGIYDPALATFRSMSGSLGGMTMASKDAIQELRCQHRPRHVCPDRRPFGRRRRGFHLERGLHEFRGDRAGRGSVERCEPPVLGEGRDPVDRCERPGLPHQSRCSTCWPSVSPMPTRPRSRPTRPS